MIVLDPNGCQSQADAIVEIDMVRVLPHYLDGLFKMLADRNEDIRQSVDTCLGEFLVEIKVAAKYYLSPF